MPNPYCNCGHMVVQHIDRLEQCTAKYCECKHVNNNEIEFVDDAPKESNLVAHARRELEISNVDEQLVPGIIEIVKIFASQGHSGGSAPHTIEIIYDLLRFRPLGPITDDPDEWVKHDASVWDGRNGVWQNKRDSRAFSSDNGVTYWLVDDHRGVPRETLPSDNGPTMAARRKAEEMRRRANEISAPYDR